MVNAVSGAVLTGVVTFARPFPVGVAGIVADKPGASDQQVKQEAQHLHADRDEKEDERVPPFVGDQQLGEDARQRDNHPCRAWIKAQEGEGTVDRKEMGMACMWNVGFTYSLQSSPPVCTSWAASPCNHRNWTAALGREEEVAYQCLAVNAIRIQFI